MKSNILFIVFALLLFLMASKRMLKRKTSSKDVEFNRTLTGIKANWGKGDCSCGIPRNKWKALAMNRPDNTVLLYCPQCLNLWEESMSMYSNKWRPVDESYAKANYDYVKVM